MGVVLDEGCVLFISVDWLAVFGKFIFLCVQKLPEKLVYNRKTLEKPSLLNSKQNS